MFRTLTSIIFLICLTAFSVTFAIYPVTEEAKKYLLYNWHEKHYRGIDNLEEIWEIYSDKRYEEAVFLCTLRIEDPTIDKIEKFHFLIARSVFCLALDDLQMYTEDVDKIIKMIKEDEKTEFVYFVFYRKLYYYQTYSIPNRPCYD